MEKVNLGREGRRELVEIEGGEGEFGMISQEPTKVAADIDGTEILATGQPSDNGDTAMVTRLREEAYHWPRLVAPPLKRSGHVVMDACCSNGWSLSSLLRPSKMLQ